eukprot:6688155-Heterocapsa_arctica.AAC.1
MAPPMWDPVAPWSACLFLIANDQYYWTEQVRDLAGSWLAHGWRGSPLTREEEVIRQAAPSAAIVPLGGKGGALGAGADEDRKRRQAASLELRSLKKARKQAARAEGAAAW